jgi:hypothetical protein
MIQRAFLLVLIVLAAAWTPRTCLAQEYRATITGTVADPSKALLPNVPVTVRNLDTGEVAVVNTSAAGIYTANYLHPGQRYEISVDAPGFKKSIHPAVVLSVAQIFTADFTLEVGNAASESVTVTASDARVALDTETADRGTVVDNKTITELPIDGRNPLALLDEVAGVTNENGPGSQGVASDMYNASWYTINGGPAQNTEYDIDGQPDNSIPWWSSGPSAIPSVDAIQEFKVITNPYDAQMGRTSGGVVSMELKSGTNALHGAAYEFAKRGYMDANRYENGLTGTPRPGHTEDQYGVEVGGPVRLPHIYNGRDKTFFMFNAEIYRQKLPKYGLYDVPNPAWVQGDFSGFTNSSGALYPVYDVNTANAGNNYARTIFQTPNTGAVNCGNAQGYNCVPTNRFNPIAVKILNMAIAAMTPTPNMIPGQQPWENIWVDRQPENNRMDNYITKVDQVISAKDRLSVNYIHDTNLVQFLFTPAGVPWENGENFQENHQNAGIDWVHTQRDNLLFDVHLSYQYYWRSDGWPGSTYDPTQLGWSSAYINSLPYKVGFPQITWSMQEPTSAQGQGYGNWPLMSRDYYYIPDDTFSLAPTVTWNKGKHDLRAGIDMRTTHNSEDTNWTNVMQINSNGEATQEYWYSGAFDDGSQLPSNLTSAGESGNPFLDFLLGQQDSTYITNQVFPVYTWHYIAPWVQDDWRVTPRLTLNLGLRYDLATPPTARHDWLSTGFNLKVVNPLDSATLDAQFPDALNGHLLGGYTFVNSAGNTGGRHADWNTDWNTLQPRLGFAYLLRPTTILRGGAGRLIQAQMGDQPSQVGYSLGPNFANTYNGGETYVNSGSPDGMLSNPFFNTGGIPTIPMTSLGLKTNLGLGAAFWNPNHKWPYIYQMSLGVEQVIGHSGKLEVSYVGSRTRGEDENSPNLAMNEPLYQSCNDLNGTPTNPDPRMTCQARYPNPLYGNPAVLGSWEASPTLSNLSLHTLYPLFGNSVTEQGMNWGSYAYNSMQSTYEQRTNWEQFSVSWTWSKTTQAGGYVDSNYLVPMRSIAGTDRTHRVTLTGVQTVPLGRGQKYLSNVSRGVDAAIGGWEVSEAFFLETGEPWANPSGYNLEGSIHGPHRNQSANQLIDLGVNHCVWQWVPSTSATPGYYQHDPNVVEPFDCEPGSGWYQVAPYAPVTAQPYSDQIRIPGTNQLDMNIAKMWTLTHYLRMQTRMEVTNVLNHPTFYYDTSNGPENWDFGTADKSYGQSNNPRYVQLAVKVIW